MRCHQHHKRSSGLTWTYMVCAVLSQMACHAGSLNPFFPSRERVLVPQAEGRWVQVRDGDEQPMELTITRGAEKSYRVIIMEPSQLPGGKTTTEFDVYVARLDNVLLVDGQVSLSDPGYRAISSYVVQPRFLVKAALAGDDLSLYGVDRSWLEGRINDGQLKLAHGVEDRQETRAAEREKKQGQDPKWPFIMFTAPTQQLWTAVKRFGRNPAAFERDPLVRLHRAKGADIRPPAGAAQTPRPKSPHPSETPEPSAPPPAAPAP